MFTTARHRLLLLFTNIVHNTLPQVWISLNFFDFLIGLWPGSKHPVFQLSAEKKSGAERSRDR